MITNSFKAVPLSAGHYWSDAGAAFGVLPRALWNSKIETDIIFRMKMELRCLLIIDDNHKILVDTGIGDLLNEKMKKIYNPSLSTLRQSLLSLSILPEDIDTVILTHLHFDHIGGVLSITDNSTKLTFPNASYLVQEKEWHTAMNPDELNRPAYPLHQHLEAIEASGKLQLCNGDFLLTPHCNVRLAQGHSEGFQYVECEYDDRYILYPGDIIPSQWHINLGIVSAYDVCRKQSFLVKQSMLEKVQSKKGTLIFNHDTDKVLIQY